MGIGWLPMGSLLSEKLGNVGFCVGSLRLVGTGWFSMGQIASCEGR